MEITLNELVAAIRGQPATTLNGGSIGHPFNVGGKYFIRTVTHHHTGELVAVYPQELVLRNAAWIADDGRLTDALKASEFNEVEMFPPDKLVIVGRASIIDAVEITSLPTSQK